MSSLKINIFYNFANQPWGGGNQFLKTLKKQFIFKGVYEKDSSKADCIIFNSHHKLKEIIKLKKKYPRKIFIHRIDGPICLIRGRNLMIDKQIYKINNKIADGTIFQSKWSKRQNYRMGLKKNSFETIIMNASDPTIFFPTEKKIALDWTKKKCKIVAVSWSNNMSKGFDLYKFLDENLDFNQYSMKFIGNSPLIFKNIKNIGFHLPIKLSRVLRNCDIYLTGSKSDPCSNSLIEALTCGLPSVALNDGGHPEIIKKGGVTFNTFKECLKKIQLIRDNYDFYRKIILVPTIEDISEYYLRFVNKISIWTKKGYKIKQISVIDYILTLFTRYFWYYYLIFFKLMKIR